MRIHVFKPVEGIGLTPWFEGLPESISNTALAPGVQNPFRGIEQTTLTECDAAFVPNNFRHELTPIQQADVTAYIDAAVEAHKKVFLFSCGDFTDDINFDPRAYVFRYSVYSSSLSVQDLVAPTITRDQGIDGYSIREKKEVPIVSFCGQAGYRSLRQWVKYVLKVTYYRARALGNPMIAARIIGVYWRRRMLSSCRRSARVRTNFILRRSFSGAARTIELDPVQAHKEFVGSITESDFVLAPKGDGNYSNRFLEALSLGRIPVLLDTDSVLPMEELIPHERTMVRIPMTDVDQTPEYIRNWYDGLSESEWKVRQEEARSLFATKLRFDSYFKEFFTVVLPLLPLDPRQRTIATRR